MNSSRFLFAVLSSAIVLCGCDNRDERPAHARAGQATVAENGAAFSDCVILLNRLLNDEKHLSKLLLVKKEADPLEKLVKEISDRTGKHARIVEKMGADRIDFEREILPSGEVLVRDAIASSRKERLLASKKAEFEFQLLLTQVEALNYGIHLSRVAAATTTDAEHASQLQTIETDLQKLLDDTESLLRPHGVSNE